MPQVSNVHRVPWKRINTVDKSQERGRRSALRRDGLSLFEDVVARGSACTMPTDLHAARNAVFFVASVLLASILGEVAGSGFWNWLDQTIV